MRMKKYRRKPLFKTLTSFKQSTLHEYFKTDKARYILHDMMKKYSKYNFRVRGINIQRQRKSGWVTICSHNREGYLCKDCKGASICKCGKQKAFCKKCNGSAFCKCGKQSAFCRKCNGSVFCKCGKQSAFCRKCNGSVFCKCGKQRAFCIKCNGSALCECGVQRAFCIKCNGSQICKCGLRSMALEGYCLHCHPTYVFSKRGFSKIACLFFDMYEEYLDIKIQHKHLDKDCNKWIGCEHRPTLWKRKPIDGFFIKDGCKVAVEFLGDVFHGYPKLWENDHTKKNYLKKSYKYLFEDTQKKMLKLCDLGYVVYYIWESDFRNNGITSIRKFNSKLY